MSLFQKAADVVHKTVVTGLVAYTGFFAWQIIKNSREGIVLAVKNPSEDYLETLKGKAEEDYSKHYDINHRDWYEKDDQSYLKNAPKANK